MAVIMSRETSLTFMAIIGLLIGGWLIARSWGDAEGRAVQPNELPEMVFVCRESGDMFVGRARPIPAIHPHSGRPTLMQGWYCPERQHWVAGPSYEEVQRTGQPPVSPRRRLPLLEQGPIPADAPRLP